MVLINKNGSIEIVVLGLLATSILFITASLEIIEHQDRKRHFESLEKTAQVIYLNIQRIIDKHEVIDIIVTDSKNSSHLNCLNTTPVSCTNNLIVGPLAVRDPIRFIVGSTPPYYTDSTNSSGFKVSGEPCNTFSINNPDGSCPIRLAVMGKFNCATEPCTKVDLKLYITAQISSHLGQQGLNTTKFNKFNVKTNSTSQSGLGCFTLGYGAAQDWSDSDPDGTYSWYGKIGITEEMNEVIETTSLLSPATGGYWGIKCRSDYQVVSCTGASNDGSTAGTKIFNNGCFTNQSVNTTSFPFKPGVGIQVMCCKPN